jgi:hypothetical protein
MVESCRFSSQDFLTYFSKEINGLKDSNSQTRKVSLKTLSDEITREPSLKACNYKSDIMQELLEALAKLLLKLISDEKEQIRESSIKLLCQ